jgi:hypothetical protein
MRIEFNFNLTSFYRYDEMVILHTIEKYTYNILQLENSRPDVSIFIIFILCHTGCNVPDYYINSTLFRVFFLPEQELFIMNSYDILPSGKIDYRRYRNWFHDCIKVGFHEMVYILDVELFAYLWLVMFQH